LAALIEAERSFSRMSEERGIREAFLRWLAPDAVVFRPSPVEGRPVYEKMDPADPSVLTWEPEFAEIAASGELGYTTGPYMLRPSRNAEPTGFGHYVSVWKRQPDGAWLVILDIGVRHGRHAPAAGTGQVASPPAPPQVESLPPDALRDVEYAFGIFAGAFDKAVGEKGLRRALAQQSTEDVRVYRPGRFPAVGRREALTLIPEDEGKVSGKRARQGPRGASYKVGISWTADLAYVYGTVGSGKPGNPDGAASFLRIWRRDSSVPAGYKICLDIRLPIPPKTGGGS
jgi:ketosteroid isomerase-like protein